MLIAKSAEALLPPEITLITILGNETGRCNEVDGADTDLSAFASRADEVAGIKDCSNA